MVGDARRSLNLNGCIVSTVYDAQVPKNLSFPFLDCIFRIAFFCDWANTLFLLLLFFIRFTNHISHQSFIRIGTNSRSLSKRICSWCYQYKYKGINSKHAPWFEHVMLQIWTGLIFFIKSIILDPNYYDIAQYIFSKLIWFIIFIYFMYLFYYYIYKHICIIISTLVFFFDVFSWHFRRFLRQFWRYFWFFSTVFSTIFSSYFLTAFFSPLRGTPPPPPQPVPSQAKRWVTYKRPGLDLFLERCVPRASVQCRRSSNCAPCLNIFKFVWVFLFLWSFSKTFFGSYFFLCFGFWI